MDIKFVDADRHVSEPIQMWRDYLPKGFHDYIPYIEPIETNEPIEQRLMRLGPKGSVSLLPDYKINGFSIFYKWPEKAQIEAAIQKETCKPKIHIGSSPELQLKSMDDTGVSTAQIFPTFATFIVNHEEIPPHVSTALAIAYNNWLFDYCSREKERLRGVGLISRHEPDTMVNQLNRVIEYGWKTVVLRPEVILGRVVGHSDYEVFWKACEERDISIAFHGGTHLHAPTAGTERFESHFALHACSHPHEAQMAFLSLLESGVFERYPRLKFAFLEAGASWVPHWLWRLDEICYDPMPGEVSDTVKMKPSEYFKRQCWVGMEIGEPCLKEVINMIGPERLLYGTDFPHPDHLHFDINDLINDDTSFSQEELKLILETNPRTFFGA